VLLPEDVDTVISAVIAFVNDPTELMMLQVHDTELQKRRDKSPELHAMPTYFVITDVGTFEYWPKADRDYDLKIRYFPHRKEV
jgi:hypothetical protein